MEDTLQTNPTSPFALASDPKAQPQYEVLKAFLDFHPGDLIGPDDPMYSLARMETMTGRTQIHTPKE